MPHDHPHPQGHNHAADHLHSHMDEPDRAEALRALAAEFIDAHTDTLVTLFLGFER
jgi:hypothetical protein